MSSTAAARPTFGESVRLGEDIVAQIREAGIGEEDPDFLALVEAETDVPDRCRRMLRVARECEAAAEGLSAYLAELRERKSALEGRSERLRRIAAWALGEMGLSKLQAPDFTATLRPGRPGLVGEPDAATLPDDLYRITRTPNKTAIRAALEAGTAVPGVALGNAAPVLTLRTA